MKRWLPFFLMAISSTCLFSQTNLKRDTAYIASRSFNANALKEFKSNKDFQYDTYREPVQSLWQKFWSWVWWKVGQLLSTKEGITTAWVVLIILSIAVIVYFAIKITGIGQDGLFGRSNKGLQKYTLSQNDIHLIPFNDAIEKAINNGDYRLATRLYYLQALKKLSDKGYIEWRINKTNTDYLREITGKPFNDMFILLTFNFEYTWYGEKQVSREQFSEIRERFQQFNNQV